MFPLPNFTEEQALHLMKKAGFPGRKHEEWKYTPLSSTIMQQFGSAHLSQISEKGNLTLADIEPHLIPGNQHRLVFVNGYFSSNLSDHTPPAGLHLQPLAQALPNEKAPFASLFGTAAGAEEDFYVATNTALFTDGLALESSQGKTADKPTVIYLFNDARTAPALSYVRLLLLAQANSELNITVVQQTIGSQPSYINLATEVFVKTHGRAKFHLLQEETEQALGYTNTLVRQEKESYFGGHTFSFSGRMLRNNLFITLDGQHTETDMYGLYMLNDQTHVDNHTAIDHAQPNCNSNEFYKGVLDGSSKGVFNGKVFVRQDAQKTNAFQSNRNLILSPKATVDTKPQLEIYADDVKCSHGATIGKLDKEALFYLQARGINKQQAQSLLTKAFAQEIVDRVAEPLVSDYLEKLIDRKLFDK